MSKGAGRFEIVSKFKPSGDQPTAIAGLVEGLKKGEKVETLLGATGTGKSVAWSEPVTVDLGEGNLYRGPIGKLLDSVFGDEQAAETAAALPPGDWKIFAWDEKTGRTEWRNVTALTRHDAPEQMFTLRTACGRSVEVTGDHSVWALREGTLQLLPGSEVRAGDALPIPARVPEPGQPLKRLNLLERLADTSLLVQLPEGRVARTDLHDALSADFAQPYQKRYRVLIGGEPVSMATAQRLVRAGAVSLADLRMRSSSRRYDAPASLPITDDLCLVLGQYLAEGHSADRFSLISTRDAEVQNALDAALRESGIPSYRRPDGDFVIATRIWHALFSTSMGTHAGSKRLPDFWPALDNAHLAALLRGYFEGDGGVEKGGVLSISLSAPLTADIAEALLRFGIWARIRPAKKRKPNGDYGVYHKLTISGADNLARYAQHIGFLSDRKRTALDGLLTRSANTNVDLIFGVGERLRQARLEAGLLQREVAARAGCHRAMVGMIETGDRQPSRELFVRLCSALAIDDAAFVGLANVHWSPVEQVEVAPPTSEYVYDFSVEGYETFLTGRGGLFVHNTFTAACVIEKLQRPALVIAHNKTLAAQLCSEFREFFPNNAVEYFVSYYDYYQPEAYIPQTDTFIEKDSSINEEVNRLRHSATQAVLERRDVIIVASVSCIYGLGSPESYQEMMVWFHRGQTYDRDDVIRRLVSMQFTRNDMVLTLGTFRVKGDTLEIQPRDEEVVYRIEFDFDEVSRITLVDSLTGEMLEEREELTIYPASHFVTDPDRLESAMRGIEEEMREQVRVFQREGKLIEAQRIEQRTKFDLEMIREMGFCSGIENYSRWMDGRAPGTAPHTLLDYFPKDMLIFIDESHQTIPQLHAMFAGDKRRKDTLIEFGFRLPSAADNRPLRFQEFEERMKQVVFISATPGPYEKQNSDRIVEQIIRPTGLIDPEIIIRPTKGQIDDLINEIRARTEKGERVLVTTLTKKMSEDLTEYLVEIGVKVNYLHSDIQTLERTEILRDLRLGIYDVIVGINLLREGLDLPEVSLVAILDADKEGFLRSETSLVQTIGRAARNVGGQVIMYADHITGSMQRAIDETNRRREKQVAYNTEHDITPYTVVKAVRDVLESKKVAEAKSYYKVVNTKEVQTLPLDQILLAVTDMEKEMKTAARALDFETAAQLRDEIGRLKKLLPAGSKK